MEGRLMTPEQMRIVITEELGYSKHNTNNFLDETKSNCEWKRKDGCWFYDIPNYPTDLNACHEMEKVIWSCDRATIFKYLTNLGRIVSHNPPDALEATVIVMKPTAFQRCETWIKTK